MNQGTQARLCGKSLFIPKIFMQVYLYSKPIAQISYWWFLLILSRFLGCKMLLTQAKLDLANLADTTTYFL
jgi:hypothetical protein